MRGFPGSPVASVGCASTHIHHSKIGASDRRDEAEDHQERTEESLHLRREKSKLVGIVKV